VTGLVKQAAFRAAVFMRRKQAQNPMGFFAIRVVSVVNVVSMVTWGNRFVFPGMDYPMYQSLGLGQQQGAGPEQQHAGPPCTPRRRKLSQHWRMSLPCFTPTAAVTRSCNSTARASATRCAGLPENGVGPLS